MKQRAATSDNRFSGLQIRKIVPHIFTVKAMTYRLLLQYFSILFQKKKNTL